MHRVVIVLAGLVAAAALGLAWRSDSHDATCATTLDFDGVSYSVHQLTDEIVGSRAVGVGVERGCGDDGRWSEEVAVSRIAGVDPRHALVTPLSAHVLYVAEGVTVDELPGRVAALVTQ